MSKKTLAPSRTVTTRDPKGLKFMSIPEAAYNKAALTEEEAQRVNDAAGLSDLVKNFIAENRNPDKFKDEEARSTYRYPSEYKGPKPLEKQIKALAALFGLDPTPALEYATNLPPLPEGAEGWFAVLAPQFLANQTEDYLRSLLGVGPKEAPPSLQDPAEQYCQAIQLVHTKIVASRRFYNYREGQITPDRLRIHVHTAEAISQITAVQKGDILAIACQLGMRHRGRSTRRAREVFGKNEFGLGSLFAGSIILTHPERVVRWEELEMDCPGDEFAPDADGQFSGAPFFHFGGGKVGFGTKYVGTAREDFGSASAFLSQ